MKVTRIFDLLDNYVEKYASREVVLAGKVNHEWVKYDIHAYIERANTISYALIEKGVQHGHNVGIISSNRPEWNFFDMGIMQTGAVCIPIYPTISESDYLHILNHAEIEYLFIDSAELFKKLKPVLAQSSYIKEVVCLEETEGTTLLDAFYTFGNQHADPARLTARKEAVKPEDLATMI